MITIQPDKTKIMIKWVVRKMMIESDGKKKYLRIEKREKIEAFSKWKALFWLFIILVCIIEWIRSWYKLIRSKIDSNK